MSATIEIETRSYAPAQVRSSSVDREKRTVEVVWSTGAPVKRYSWDEGYYIEELSMEPAAIDLERLNAGASFLDTHAQGTLANRLGAVVPGSARVKDGKGYCIVQLSTAKAGQQVLDDLAQGLPLPISVGYRVSEYRKKEGDDDRLPTLMATRWEPLEISAVSVPADPGAYARSAATEARRHTVPVNPSRPRQERAGEQEPPMSTDTVERTAVDAEIRQIGEHFDVRSKLVRKAIDGKKSVSEFREMILDDMRDRQSRNEIFTIAPMDYDPHEMPLSDRFAEAILARIQPRHKLNPAARDFVGLPMAEMARAALKARNESTSGMRPSQLLDRALHTSSDFSIALSTVTNRLVRAGYEAAPSQIRRIARETSVRDFRSKTSLQLAEAGSLEKVNEHGEFKRGTWSETGESYRIDTFGKILGLTRQALINDDLDLLAQVPARLGEYASRFESSFLSKLVEQPPKMSDGKALFHADHGNLAAAGTPISVSSLGVARLALRRQRGVAGEVIAVEPKFLLVPPELETVAEQTLSDINASKVEDANPFAGRLELVVEPHLKNADAWYLAASPVETGLEYAYLEGETGPQIEAREGFDIDGTEWKIRLDFGGGFVDHRGIYKNPGVA